MCRSMGPGPQGASPGQQATASPSRASKDPRKSTEARICPMSSSGMVWPRRQVGSTITVAPSRLTRQPRPDRIPRAAEISVRSGQLCNTLSPSASRVAAKRGGRCFSPRGRRPAPPGAGRPPPQNNPSYCLPRSWSLSVQAILCRRREIGSPPSRTARQDREHMGTGAALLPRQMGVTPRRTGPSPSHFPGKGGFHRSFPPRLESPSSPWPGPWPCRRWGAASRSWVVWYRVSPLHTGSRRTTAPPCLASTLAFFS